MKSVGNWSDVCIRLPWSDVFISLSFSHSGSGFITSHGFFHHPITVLLKHHLSLSPSPPNSGFGLSILKKRMGLEL